MTSQAFSQTLEREATRPAIDEPTATLQAADVEPILDAFELLDHRARSRAIPAGIAPAGHYLALRNGDQPLLIRLESTITHIGRSGACDVRFEDQRVSRDHAIIVRHGRYARILDNRSSNGTFLNGRRILAMNIRDNDVIRLGPIAMQYTEIR